MTPKEAKLICRTARTIDDGTEIELLQAAHLIAALAAERDGLAGLVVQMRDALEKIAWKKLLPHIAESVASDALALTPTAAEAQVREWREKAELLDWLCYGKYADVSTRIDEWMDLFAKSDLSVEESLVSIRLRAAREEASDARQ